MTTNMIDVQDEQQPATADLSALAEQLVTTARTQGVELTGPGGLLTGLTRQVLETALEIELGEHLGHERGERSGSGNVRNGSSAKTVRTDVGEVRISVPRDRAGTFAPAVVPKHSRRLAGFDDAVLSLYAKGMTTGDIANHLADIYGTNVSRDLVSRVTDAVIEDMQQWQSRPLDSCYPVVLIDAIVLKIRDGQVRNRPVYVAMGITVDGERDVLGLWAGPVGGGEGAKQWMTMLTELRNRGVADVCIVCCDGLKGLPDAISATWPLATVQTCVVHLFSELPGAGVRRRSALRVVGDDRAADEVGEVRHAEVDGVGPGGELVELGEFLLGAGEADAQSVEFAEPALLSGFGDAVEQVVADFDEPGALCGVGSKQWTAQAGMLMNTRRVVGAPACPERHLAAFEVAEELVPFGVGGGAVFLAGA